MSTALNAPVVSRLSDADMQAVPTALARAALRAREVAARTGTPLVVARNGKLIEAVVQPDLAAVGNSVARKH
ncbi:MAG: hypothetical protein COW39_02820 [Comamonadaceae bacterium CG17_big_fil_post_rev_8_21_14_2_50_60_13]|nr:MAG: hypothetical protein COW39_02820 [Comamonadaceae bacterium CG17_big_fil_post_rev_8_21_14_2_50_60_13]